VDKNKPYNIIVSGVGGQGVLTLTRIFWRLCDTVNINCQGATFKGGAQRLGSIYSTMRMFLTHEPNYSFYSTEIPKGDLDLIIGLEPWETLRYYQYYNKNTRIYMNKTIVPGLDNNYRSSIIAGTAITDPVKVITDMNLRTTVKDYTAQSVDDFGSTKMVNFLIGLDAVKSGTLPFGEQEFINAFNELGLTTTIA